jgi:hypothetical protein
VLLLLAGSYANPASAELLGGVTASVGLNIGGLGDTVGKTVGAVGSTVGGVVGSVGTTVGSLGSTTVSAGTSLGGQPLVGATVGVNAQPVGTLKANVCLGLNAPSSCTTARSAGPNPSTPGTQGPKPGTPGVKVARSDSRDMMEIRPIAGSFNWMVGMHAISRDRIIVGTVNKVSSAQGNSAPIITILLYDGRTIRIENGLQGVDTSGVRLVLTSQTLTARNNPNNVLLSVKL